MNTLKRIMKFIGVAILVLMVGLSLYIYNSGPQLPEESERIINEVSSSLLPEQVKGQTGFANSNEIKIWYENINPNINRKGVVLLVMGISNDALGWPPKFIESLSDAGYQVIRYDHRGTGLSDWIEEFDNQNAYSLSDMADDAIAVLDVLDIDEANIVGVSMGGMIAQQIAINHSERVQTLTSVMSSGDIFDDNLPPISTEVAYELIQVAIKYSIFKSEENMIKLHLSSRMILMGESNHEIDIKELSELVMYNIRKRKGYNPDASKQHQVAVSKSSSRYDDLMKLEIPTLIIHGVNDPFIPIEHGRKCVNLIPDADSLWVENMGHDIPADLIPIITQKMFNHFKK